MDSNAAQHPDGGREGHGEDGSEQPEDPGDVAPGGFHDKRGSVGELVGAELQEGDEHGAGQEAQEGADHRTQPDQEPILKEKQGDHLSHREAHGPEDAKLAQAPPEGDERVGEKAEQRQDRRDEKPDGEDAERACLGGVIAGFKNFSGGVGGVDNVDIKRAQPVSHVARGLTGPQGGDDVPRALPEIAMDEVDVGDHEGPVIGVVGGKGVDPTGDEKLELVLGNVEADGVADSQQEPVLEEGAIG